MELTKADKIAIGLQIFKTYGPVEVAAEHDVFYAGPEAGSALTAEDTKQIEDLGWRHGEYGWEIFV